MSARERSKIAAPPPPRPPRETHRRIAPAVLDARGQALQRTINEHPDDLETRAVYADLLSELGDPRGEYIQLALASEPTEAQIARRAELHDRHAPEWHRQVLPTEPGLRGALRDLAFERGFVEDVSIQIRRFDILEWLTTRTPLRALTISDYEAPPEWIPNLAEHPVLRQLRALRLFGALSTEPIIRKGDLERLEELTLAGPFDVSLARAVAESCPRLQRLTVRHTGNDAVEAEAFEAIASLPLRELELSSLTVDEAGASALASMKTLTELTLAISGALAPLNALRSNLESLRLRMPQTGAIAPFLRQPALRSLRRLDLRGGGLGPADLAPLLAGLPKGSLTHLDLSSNRIGEEGAIALVGLPALSKLEKLRFSQCGLAGDGFSALARAEWPLREADFGLNTLDEQAAKALAEGPLCRELRALRLSMTKIGSRAAKVLGRAPWLEHLDTLFLFSNKMGNTGLRALLERMPNARDLGLSRENNFREEGLLVATRGLLPRLQRLRLDDVSAETIIAFIESGFGDDLRSAYFNHSQLSVEAATALTTLPKVGNAGAAWSQLAPGALDILRDRWPRFAT